VSNQVESYRRILKSSSLIGGASVINILIGLIRTKAVAVLLGPAGLGFISLYTSLIAAAGTVASMGIGTVGTRQIAEATAQDDINALVKVRRAMFWGALLLACFGALVVFSFKDLLAVKVLGGIEHSQSVGWLSLGVALSVAGASQGALIQGMRRIGDMARLSVYGSILNTLLGVAILWKWGIQGLTAYVLVGPLISFLLGHWYVSRLPKLTQHPVTIQEIAYQWQILLQLGIPFMGAGVMGTLVQLWIRIEVGNTLGAEALGHFQASWVISMQYISFVLGAMGADYYPRLTGVIKDHKAATLLVNEQTEIALLLSTPVFIAMIGLTPWVVKLLYSAEFMPATDILRWQILGDVLKVASWPLGFVILASGAGKTFFWTESLVLILMGGLIAVFASSLGLQITGIAFLACYITYLPLVYFLAKRSINFRWTKQNKVFLVSVFSICTITALICKYYYWGFIPAILTSCGFGIYALARISTMSNIGGPILKMANKFENVLKKFKK